MSNLKYLYYLIKFVYRYHFSLLDIPLSFVTFTIERPYRSDQFLTPKDYQPFLIYLLLTAYKTHSFSIDSIHIIPLRKMQKLIKIHLQQRVLLQKRFDIQI